MVTRFMSLFKAHHDHLQYQATIEPIENEKVTMALAAAHRGIQYQLPLRDLKGLMQDKNITIRGDERLL